MKKNKLVYACWNMYLSRISRYVSRHTIPAKNMCSSKDAAE